MIVDLVMYFLRQGEYNGQGDIAVLCAYLGQLQKVRLALRSLKVTVAVDERDEDQLVKQGLQGEDEVPSSIEEVMVTKHVRWVWRIIGTWPNLGCEPQVRLGTVDIFQGQEAKIVIVSLVRNSGEFDTGNASIGFLKVAVTRYCHLDDPANFELVGESHQRRSVTSQAWALYHGQCFKPTEEPYLVHNPR